MKRALIALALSIGIAGGAAAQIPRLPGARPATPQPVRRDSTKDTTKARFAAPDSITERLLRKPGYSITRYTADTGFFNVDGKSINLLAGKKRLAIVDRDTQVVTSDSGIYYNQTTHGVVTGGKWTVTPPASSGQAEIQGHDRFDYDFNGRSARFRNAKLPVNNGEVWYLTIDEARVDLDTTSAKSSTAYIRGGTMTSCDDSVPDFYFKYGEAKRTGNNTLVARPAVLYIAGVPVIWLPFIFTDTRSGRHSGILAPQFGIGDIVRNSPTYRRNVEHVGYYWAPSEYYDFSTWLDWRSNAGATDFDPGWLRFNGDWSYKWLDRFLGGHVGASYTAQNDGSTNKAVTWTHQQDFGRNNHLSTNVNFVTDTRLQRQNTFNPYSALATISSQASYQSKIGPASLSFGATRKQYPGRKQIDQTIPTFSLTSSPISIGDKFSWTPGFSFSRSDVLKMDQPGIGRDIFFINEKTGLRDSSLATNRNSANASMSFDSPIQIFGYSLGNSFKLTQQRINSPQQFKIYDVTTGAELDNRVYAATYRSDFDYTPSFTLPSLGQNKWNLTPSLSLQNVDPGPLFVASERTNGKYVGQSKRFTVGMSASPTFYAFFFDGGIGPFQRIRHSITPSIGWSGATPSDVSDEYLIALGRTRKGYLGNRAVNTMSFGITQNFEGKLRSTDTATDRAQRIKLLSINMSPLSYDFERARGRASRWTGFTSESFSYSLSSELLPGFDFSSNYSLFEGSTLSDSAKFSPYLTGISASFNVGRDQNPFTVFARLFGRAVPETQKSPNPSTEQVRPRPDDAQAQAIAAQPVAGSSRAGNRFIIPPTQGWKASFSFSRSSPRPPTGTNVIDYDPRQRCLATVGTDPFLLDACLANQRAQPSTEQPVTSATAGAQAYRIPPTTSLNSDLSFNLTPKWAAHWTTTYDVERHEFASHIVQLQREIHDWRAIFGFTQSPNGNFAFNFTIALKAEPDLKFDYNRQTVRSQSF